MAKTSFTDETPTNVQTTAPADATKPKEKVALVVSADMVPEEEIRDGMEVMIEKRDGELMSLIMEAGKTFKVDASKVRTGCGGKVISEVYAAIVEKYNG